MPDIPIHNETDYTFTSTICEQIVRDALEYFGESVRSIRVQYGIQRHAFNSKTGEMRFAFSPSDFGVVDTSVALSDTYYSRTDVPSIDDDTREVIIPAAFADDEDDEDDEDTETEVRTPRLTSLEDELDEGDEDDDDLEFQGLEDQFEEDEDEAGGLIYDEDEYD